MNQTGNNQTASSSVLPVTVARPDTVVAAGDSIGVETVDSLVLTQAVPGSGITLTPPAPLPPAAPVRSDTDSSVVALVLLALFCTVAFRYRGDMRSIGTMLRDLTDVRVRQNVFDDTVRETSFRFLLNVLQSVCAGVIMAYAIVPAGPTLEQTGWCVLLGLAYTLVMWVAYGTVGTVFSDGTHARMWTSGFTSSQGLLGLFLLPLALLCVGYPGDSMIFVIIGMICFFLGKITFILKGFRIFFTRFSSWILFLYYLCSLEIVPLIITVVSAMFLCGK